MVDQVRIIIDGYGDLCIPVGIANTIKAKQAWEYATGLVSCTVTSTGNKEAGHRRFIPIAHAHRLQQAFG